MPAGDGKANCPSTTTVAYAGAETGPNAQLGINIFNGIQLAINQHNTANDAPAIVQPPPFRNVRRFTLGRRLTRAPAVAQPRFRRQDRAAMAVRPNLDP